MRVSIVLVLGSLQHEMYTTNDCIVGLVVKASTSRADPEFKTRLCQELSHTSALKIGTPMVTLPGAWRYRVSAGAGWADVSIL